MRTIQVSEIIDVQKFNRFHLQILLCCIFIIICDGYDMFMLGTILSSLMAEWRITAVEAGLFSSYALFGMMMERWSLDRWRINSAERKSF
ncbi:hypothetical protein [Peribacillus frigoritolerans]|uniref:hypothetical protein n=1 Tax=Peribacillus frigoritolerans TaxID=450367 RepID=UPI0020BDA851|nr:hypothetical protein [Peribacillus frigoritolerans]MEE3952244.1 hypothetical protein [Peribacillus frigoritolerans]